MERQAEILIRLLLHVDQHPVSIGLENVEFQHVFTGPEPVVEGIPDPGLVDPDQPVSGDQTDMIRDAVRTHLFYPHIT